MNRLRELSSQVMDVYQSLSQEFSAFQSTAIKPPMVAEGRRRLAQLDYELGDKLMPINDALRFMLEKILTLSFYSQDIDDGVAA